MQDTHKVLPAYSDDYFSELIYFSGTFKHINKLFYALATLSKCLCFIQSIIELAERKAIDITGANNAIIWNYFLRQVLTKFFVLSICRNRGCCICFNVLTFFSVKYCVS